MAALRDDRVSVGDIYVDIVNLFVRLPPILGRSK